MRQSNAGYTLILGVDNGLGLQDACALAEAGVQLLLVASRMDKLQTLRRKLPVRSEVKLFVCDLTDVQSRLKLLEDIAAQQIKVDSLVNGAGDAHIWAHLSS